MRHSYAQRRLRLRAHRLAEHWEDAVALLFKDLGFVWSKGEWVKKSDAKAVAA
jgi:hypothetical protein